MLIYSEPDVEKHLEQKNKTAITLQVLSTFTLFGQVQGSTGHQTRDNQNKARKEEEKMPHGWIQLASKPNALLWCIRVVHPAI